MKLWPSRRKKDAQEDQRSVTFQDLWGSGASQIELLKANSIDTALSLVPVFAATRLIADSIASLPLQTYRKTGDASKRISDPTLISNPSAYGTSYDWVHRAITSLVIRGNAYGLVVGRDAFGLPKQIEWLHPDQVGIYDNRTIAPPIWYYYGEIIPNENFLHIPWFPLPGLVVGMSPIGAYRTTLETGLQAQLYGRDWFANGSIPSGVLETDQPVTKDQSDVIKSRFKKAADGRDLVVLGNGAHFKPITVMPEEAQFLGTLKATATQIASIYGLPPELIGGDAGGTMTYRNAEQQHINFVTFTLQPYLAKIERALSALLPRGQYVKFDVDSILRADTLTRYQAHHIALSDGWKNRDEIREVEDMSPLPNGEGQIYGTPAPPDPAITNPPPPDDPAPDEPPQPQGGTP